MVVFTVVLIFRARLSVMVSPAGCFYISCAVSDGPGKWNRSVARLAESLMLRPMLPLAVTSAVSYCLASATLFCVLGLLANFASMHIAFKVGQGRVISTSFLLLAGFYTSFVHAAVFVADCSGVGTHKGFS